MHYDIILLGAGCSSMQLLHAMLRTSNGKKLSILILEKEQDFPEKSWCFWSKNHTEYDSLVSKKWNQIEFFTDGYALHKAINPYQYKYIHSQTFFDFHLDLIHKSGNVDFFREEVLSVDRNDQIFSVKTTKTTFTATQVFSSMYTQGQLRKNELLLWQHFYGFFIKTEKPVFNKDVFRMMDFRIPQSSTGSHFIYILPFSETEALVEFTAFSSVESYKDSQYKDYLATYIQTHFLTNYQISRIERGKIPMTNAQANTDNLVGIIPIGGRAGAIKPSTGYAFNRIRKNTEKLLEANFGLESNNSFNQTRFQFYDTLLLQIIKTEPERIQDVMEQLFRNNELTTILKFLDEETTMMEDLKIFTRLPIPLFLNQVKHYMYGRI
jgi:lycopene beta-cyclase